MTGIQWHSDHAHHSQHSSNSSSSTRQPRSAFSIFSAPIVTYTSDPLHRLNWCQHGAKSVKRQQLDKHHERLWWNPTANCSSEKPTETTKWAQAHDRATLGQDDEDGGWSPICGCALGSVEIFGKSREQEQRVEKIILNLCNILVSKCSVIYPGAEVHICSTNRHTWSQWLKGKI